MVFESIVAEILNKFLGKYVQNFDSNKLRLGLWGGDVVLNDLFMLPSALDELRLPIRCCYGYLGQLVLKIPWKDIYNSPCVVVIDRLFLIAIPCQHVRYDPILEARLAKEQQVELRRVEEAKRRELEKDILNDVPVNETFTEKIIANVIKNIQITIKNIHIRYEDRLSHAGNPFSLGITLSSFELKTGKPWHSYQNISFLHLIYKDLSMNLLSAYLNSKDKMFSLLYLDDSVKLQEAMQLGIASDTHSVHHYKHVLGPIIAKANLQINMKPEDDEKTFSIPKFVLKLNLEKLHARISKLQFEDVSCFLHSIDNMTNASRYRKYRPSVNSYIGHAKLWWRFAYTCIVKEQIEKRKRMWNWNHIRAYRQIMKDYAEAYKEKLIASKPSKIILDKCDLLEDQLDIFAIIVARQIAESQLTKDELLVAKGLKNIENEGWMARWFGTSQPTEPSNLREKFNAVLTKEERQKMFRAIGYTEGEIIPIYPDNFIEIDFKSTIHEITIDFIHENLIHPTVMSLMLETVFTAFQYRPAVKGLKFILSVDKFTVNGTPQGGKTCKIVKSYYDSRGSIPLLMIEFDINPIDRKVDHRLNIKANPLIIIYDTKTLKSILNIFETGSQIPSVITVAAQEKMDELTQLSSLGLQHMLETRSTFEIRASIKASSLFIPYNGLYILGNPVMIISLGNMTVTTQPRVAFIAKDLATISTEEVQKNVMMKNSYDYFSIKLTDLQVIYAMKGEKWSALKSDMLFLKPTTLCLELGKCIIPNDPLLPKLKISGKLPMLEVSLTEKRFVDFMSLLRSLTILSAQAKSIYHHDAPINQIPHEMRREGGQRETEKRWSERTGSMRISGPRRVGVHLSRKPLLVKQTGVQKVPQFLVIPSGTQQSLAQFFKNECIFHLEELCLTIFKSSSEDVAEKLLHFNLRSLVISYMEHSFNSKLSVELGSILLQHHYNKNWINVISTPLLENDHNNNYLMKITYTNIDKNSPEFVSKFESYKSIVHIDLTKLEFLADCDAFTSLIAWYQGFKVVFTSQKEQYRKDMGRIHGSLLSASIFQINANKANVAGITKVVTPEGRKMNGNNILVNFNLGEIVLTLATNSEKLAGFSVAGGKAKLLIKSKTIFFSANLSGIHINSYRSQSCFNKILTTKDQKKLLTITVWIYPTADQKTGTCDLSIKLSMTSLQFVHNKQFFMDALDFWRKISVAHQVIIDTSQVAAEVARQNIENVYQNASRLKLDIDLQAPLMIVPAKETTFEAFYLNMGHLTVSNTFLDLKVPSALEPAILDRIKVNLRNLNFTRMMFDESTKEIIHESPIIEPISFKLTIQRNLSMCWFQDLPNFEITGKLQAIKIFLTETDYFLIMKTFEEMFDINESGNIRPETEKYAAYSINMSSLARLSVARSQWLSRTVVVESSVRSTLKFAFTLDRVVLELFSVRVAKEIKNAKIREGLTRASLEMISLKGSQMSDDSLNCCIILHDCIVDDTRPSRTGKINRYMEHQKPSGTNDNQLNNIIEVFYQSTTAHTFVDLRISSFFLLLNMDHLEKVYSFFLSAPKNEKGSNLTEHEQAEEPTKLSVMEDQVAGSENSCMTIKFKCDQPDIVLIENLDSLNVNAIVLDFEMLFTLTTGNHNKMLLNGSICDLQLFSCSYGSSRRKHSKASILHPVTIFLTGFQDLRSVKFDLDATRIQLSLRPGLIALLSRIVSAIRRSDSVSEEDREDLIERTDTWQVKDFDKSEFVFLHPEKVKTKKLNERQAIVMHVNEIFVVKVPEVCLWVEGVVGRAPLLSVYGALDLTFSNWSYRFQIEGRLSCGMKSFNDRHAVWEPIIEPVLCESQGYRDWQLRFTAETKEVDLNAPFLYSGNAETAPLSVSVRSSDPLNITFSKSSLDIASNLSLILSEAIYQPDLYTGKKADYIVSNKIGVSINILLKNKFVEHQSASLPRLKIIHLKTNSDIGLNLVSESEHLGYFDYPREKYLHIVVSTYECHLKVSIMKVGKRLFYLNCSDGAHRAIISYLSAYHGQKLLSLQSIVQVKNELSIPLDLYYISNINNKRTVIGVMEPKNYFSIPIDTIYSDNVELFVGVEGYHTSDMLFSWKDMKTTPASSTLTYYPNIPIKKNDYSPIFLRVVKEFEEIYLENSDVLREDCGYINIVISGTIVVKNTLPVDVVISENGTGPPTFLTPGASQHLLTTRPGSSYLLIQIPNYLDCTWSCKNLLADIPLGITYWAFDCTKSSSQYLQNNIEIGVNIESIRTLLQYTLFCFFWMINRTGLLLSYKTVDKEGSESNHPPNEGIVMLSMKHDEKAMFSKKKALIKVENGEWSDKFLLHAPGYSKVLICRTDCSSYRIAIQISLTNNPLTKEVLFTPFFVFSNNHFSSIEVREVGENDGPWTLVEANECIPFWPKLVAGLSKLQARLVGTLEHTVLFPYSTGHNSILKLNNKYGALNVNIHVMETGVVISFFTFKQWLAPILLINNTQHPIDICEKSAETYSSAVNLKGGQKAFMTWETFGQRKALSFCNQKYSTFVDKDSNGKFKLGKEQLYWSTFLFGLQRILLFTNSHAITTYSMNLHEVESVFQEFNIRIGEIGLSCVDEEKEIEIVYITLSKSKVTWGSRNPTSKKLEEFSPEDCKLIETAYQDYIDAEVFLMNPAPITTFKGFTIDLKSMKVLSGAERKLERLHREGLQLILKTSTHLTKLNIQIFHLQVDQQTWGCIFPVVFLPVSHVKSTFIEPSSGPFFEMNILKIRNETSPVDQFKVFEVRMKEFHLLVDTGLLINLFRFFERGPFSGELEVQAIQDDIKHANEPLEYFILYTTEQEQKYYFEKIQLYALKMHLSFSHKAGESKEDEKNALPVILNLFVRSFGTTLTTLNNVVFKIQNFQRESVLLSRSELLMEIENHYINEIARQFYVLMFGLDALGNPYGLIKDIKQGATDLLYQPLQGAGEGGEEFAEGILFGIRSFLMHTFGATAGTVSRVTAALGEGLAALTFDNDYKMLRKEHKTLKPSNLQDGLTQSGRKLVMGVVEGVSGVIKKPVRGGREDGIGGFLRGAGRGIVGLFVKPASAIVDFTSGLFSSLAGREIVNEVSRYRDPRYIRTDGIIRPYSPVEAEGNMYFQTCVVPHISFLQHSGNKQSLKKEEYVFHMEIGTSLKNKDILLLTDKRIVYLIYDELYRCHKIDWMHDWADITGHPDVTEEGIHFWLRRQKKPVMPLWTDGKILIISDVILKKKLATIMTEYINEE